MALLVMENGRFVRLPGTDLHSPPAKPDSLTFKVHSTPSQSRSLAEEEMQC